MLCCYVYQWYKSQYNGMKTFIMQASLAYFLLCLDSSFSPQLFKGELQKSRNPTKRVRKAPNTQLAAIPFYFVLH